MFKRFFNYFEKEKIIKNKCDRCKEIGIEREAVFNLKFNGFELHICQHHMVEFVLFIFTFFNSFSGSKI